MVDTPLAQLVLDVAQRTDVGVTVTILLLALLTQKELLRAHGDFGSRWSPHALNVAIAPLLLVFTVVVAVRFLSLVNIL
jgi:hypothetical protein